LGTFQVNEKYQRNLSLNFKFSDKVTKRRVSITSFAPITTTRKTTTAAPTAKPVTTSTTTRSRNYYKVAIKDFRAKMQRNIKPNLKAGKERVNKIIENYKILHKFLKLKNYLDSIKSRKENVHS